MILAILILLILNLLATIVVGFFALGAAGYSQRLLHLLASSVMVAAVPGLMTTTHDDQTKAN